MADAIKSVVVEIETKLQGNAIDNLNKGLRTADSLSEELKRQIDVLTKAIDNTGRKPLKVNGIDTTKKELKDLQQALLLAAQEYENLSDVQKNTLSALLQENEKVVDSLEKTGAAAGNAATGTEKYLRAVNIITPLLGESGVAISLVVTNLLEYVEATKNADASGTKLGGILDVLKNKYVLLATAVTALVGVGLNEYFSKTEEGADLLQSKLEGLKSAFSNFAGGLVSIGAGILKLGTDTEGAFKDFRNALDLFLEIPDAQTRGEELFKYIDGIRDRAFNSSLEVSQLRLKLKQLEADLTEEIVTIGDARKRKQTIEDLKALNTEIANTLVLQREAELDAIIVEAAEFSQVDNVTEAYIRKGLKVNDLSEVMDKYKKRLKEANDALNDARENEKEYTRALNKKETAINNQIKSLESTALNTVLQIQNKINQTSESFIGVLLSGDIKPEDKEKVRKELLKTYGELKKEFEDAVKKTEEITPGIFNGTKDQLVQAAESIGVDPVFIQRIKDAFKDAGELFDEAFIETFLLSGEDQFKKLDEEQKKAVRERFKSLLKQVGEIVRSEGQFDDAFFQGEQEKKKFNIYEVIFGEDKEAGKEALEAFDRNIKSAFNTFIESEIAKTDFLIQEQQRRIDETTRLAAFGNAEQLQLEQERLNKLLEERRKYEQAQQAINAAAAISATAASAAYFAGTLTKTSFESTPVLAIAQSLALVAAIGAGIAQISALASGFEKGTEYLTPGQKSNKGKTDTIPAWLAPGERVVPAMINEQLKGIKNADLPKLVAAGKMALEGYGQLNTSITSNSYGFTSEAVGILKDLKQGIAEIPRALSDQIVDINFDHYGYVIQQRRVSRHAQKVKALTR